MIQLRICPVCEKEVEARKTFLHGDEWVCSECHNKLMDAYNRIFKII
jgi:ribosomal protein L37AE/L43A